MRTRMEIAVELIPHRIFPWRHAAPVRPCCTPEQAEETEYGKGSSNANAALREAKRALREFTRGPSMDLASYASGAE